jgi:hypothetical protein
MRLIKPDTCYWEGGKAASLLATSVKLAGVLESWRVCGTNDAAGFTGDRHSEVSWPPAFAVCLVDCWAVVGRAVLVAGGGGEGLPAEGGPRPTCDLKLAMLCIWVGTKRCALRGSGPPRQPQWGEAEALHGYGAVIDWLPTNWLHTS